MRRAFSWIAILLAGLTLGIGGAVWSLRSASFGDEIRVGPWTTGRNVGTADADIRTRAVVALRGLLALPAGEARYFTARTDSAGRALDGRCTYAVDGADMDARWWSITLYDRQGWLIPNPQRRHSMGTSGIGRAANGGWGFVVTPQWDGPAWIATGQPGPFELTLRLYRPAGAMAGLPSRSQMPVIERLDCDA
jgi:hypothetical protein